MRILLEHLMYAWKIITCSCFNSAYIDRTSDICFVGYYLPCSNSAHIGRTSDVCLVGLLLAPVLKPTKHISDVLSIYALLKQEQVIIFQAYIRCSNNMRTIRTGESNNPPSLHQMF